jgi:diguanylate cyclase (GGDEF)-like protein
MVQPERTVDDDRTEQIALVESLLSEQKINQAEVLVTQLLDQARILNNTRFLVQALTAQGEIFIVTSRYSQALETLFQAHEILDATVPNEDRALLHDHIGVAYGNSGLLEEALYHYEQAYQLAVEPRHRLQFEMHAALIHGNLGRWHETKKVFLEASLSGRELMDEFEWFKCQKNLIFITLRVLESEKPTTLNLDLLECQRQAELYWQEIKTTLFTILQVETLELLSEIHSAQNQHHPSLEYATRALNLVKSLNAPRTELGILLRLAITQTALGQLDAALTTLTPALELAASMGGKGLAAQINQQLSKVLEQSGQYQEALKHYQIFHQLDSEKKSLIAAARANALMTRVRLEQAELKAEFEKQRAGELSEMNIKLETMVRTDVLTGLANRRALNENLEQMFGLANRKQIAFSFAMLDLDHFKRINDLYSHSAGDAVLVRAAQILREQCRSSDMIARFGGEEFAIIFSGMVGTATNLVCERIRLAFAEHHWSNVHPNFENTNLVITISIGVCDQPQVEPEQWLVKADQALYRAKNLGRNQICFAP